jgi:hypothetical protein
VELEQALESILAGRAVLFTGAGFSGGAVNLRGTPFKTGVPFANHLARLAGLPDGTTLEDAAEWFVRQHGRDRLLEELQQEFTVKEVSCAQRTILRMPWKRLYTTNYDNVAETAAAQESKHFTAVTLSDSIRTVPRTGTLCVHLNGYIDRVDPSAFDSQIRLTDTSYLTNIVRDSTWAVTFRQDLDAARVVFFLGYSTADLDIRRLLFERPSLKAKCFFVLGPHLDPLAEHKISRFGTILPMDAEAFAAALAQTESSYSAEAKQAPINYCVQRYEPPTTTPPFEDRSVFDLFLRGDQNNQLVWQSLHGHLQYFVEAPFAATALAGFEQGARAVVAYSDLGNGKSAAMEVLKVRALDAGYDVYTVIINSDTLSEELTEVFRSPRKTLIVIEHYPEWLQVIDFMGKTAPQNCVFAFSARTSTHDVMVDRLAERLRPGKLIEIPVDSIRLKECEAISDLFDQYGLWETLASKSKVSKLKHLSQKCHSEWHAILIDRFNAPQIRDRFAPIIDKLSKSKRFYEVVMATLVLNVLEYVPSIDLLIALCGQSVLEREFKEDASVRELIDTASGRIRLRSSIAGQFILTQFADPNALVGVLTMMARASDRYADDPAYFELLKSLTRFGNLQHLFSEKDRRKAVMQYYESNKGLAHTKKHPLFWLQYAIACTVLEEFERAEKYYHTAYSLAEATDFSAYQIDNHYARFLLMRSIRSKDQGSCMKSFRMARKLIFEQIQTERRHYPFRVATNIAEFYDTFAAFLSAEERLEVARAAKHVIERIGALPKERQEQRYVPECRTAMLHVLGLAGVSL